MRKYIIGKSWGGSLALFGIVVMTKYGNSFSFHPINLIQLQMEMYIIGKSLGKYLPLFGIIVMTKYGNSFRFHPIRFI